MVLTCPASASTTQQAELTDTLGIDPSDVVRILDKLVRDAGTAAEDRSRQVVALTEAEKTALDESSKKQLRKMSKAVLTPADDE